MTRALIVLLALSLASPAYPEPTSEEQLKQAMDDSIAIQHFILLTSVHAFNGHRHHLRDVLTEMGPLLYKVSSLAAGKFRDHPIEISEGVTITVGEYVDRIIAFANLPDVS